MAQTLLIVEEALRDLKAHWFEYIKTIAQAAENQDWSVAIACHQDVDPEIQNAVSTIPIFRHARYLDNNTQKFAGERYYGFFLHSLRCLKALWPLLARQDRYDHIFVPTVLVHHLIAWWMIAQFHPHKPRHLTLFFVTNPGSWNQQTQTASLPKSALLQGILLKGFRSLVAQGRLTLGVETKRAQQEFETLTGLPFTLFPHPVPQLTAKGEALNKPKARYALHPDVKGSPSSSLVTALQQEKKLTLTISDAVASRPIYFACYGFARYEKGSDILKVAVEQFLQTQPELKVQFQIQWVDDFKLPNGNLCRTNQELATHPMVNIIDRPLLTDEYQTLLHTTDCMILPYRNSSYYARVSRVAIEAACLGIPIIYTRGGWLEELVTEFGVGVAIEDENTEELIAAINTIASDFTIYAESAFNKSEAAQHYFSGEKFCQILFSS
jgi:glycosyltransferase involved in cell wall biosynthesis